MLLNGAALNTSVANGNSRLLPVSAALASSQGAHYTASGATVSVVGALNKQQSSQTSLYAGSVKTYGEATVGSSQTLIAWDFLRDVYGESSLVQYANTSTSGGNVFVSGASITAYGDWLYSWIDHGVYRHTSAESVSGHPAVTSVQEHSGSDVVAIHTIAGSVEFHAVGAGLSAGAESYASVSRSSQSGQMSPRTYGASVMQHTSIGILSPVTSSGLINRH